MATYQRRLNDGFLSFQYSPGARRAIFYPRLVCPFTGGFDLEWRDSQGLGTVHAVTYLYPKDEPPYNVVLVDVDEGFRMMSRVLVPEGKKGDSIKIGARVRLRLMPSQGGDNVPFFEPAEEAR